MLLKYKKTNTQKVVNVDRGTIAFFLGLHGLFYLIWFLS